MSDPTQPFAPPTGMPPAAPVYSAAPRRRPWLPWVIVLGILVVIALLAGALVAVVAAVSSVRSGPDQPLATGDTGYPSSAPLECAEPCFDTHDIEATVLAESQLDLFGFTKHDFPWGTYDSTSPDELFRPSVAQWAASDGTPDACVFALGSAPAVIDLVSDDGVLDEIQYTGEHATDDVTSTLSQSVRVFADTAGAADYMASLYDQIESCPEISIGLERERYSAEITGAPALALPSDVAGVGWVRTGDPGPRWRAYVFDLQRGNLVVRTRMLTDGSVTEQDFRAFMETYAHQLASIEAAPAAAP